ncbi:hypothetical protein [Sphingomonas oryzagri]
MNKLLSAVAAAALLGTAANASTAGNLDDRSSSGSLNIQATIVPMVQISGLDDLSTTINAAQLASNFGTSTMRSQFCVYSNADTLGSYKVNVTTTTPSSDTGNPYALQGTATHSNLDYTVGYYDAATYSSTGAKFMRPSLTAAMQNTRDSQARATDTTCTAGGLGGANSSLQVGIRNAVALAALADTYTGTLNVVVSIP